MESSRRVFLPKLAAGELWRVGKEVQIEQMKGKYGVEATPYVLSNIESNFIAALGVFSICWHHCCSMSN